MGYTCSAQCAFFVEYKKNLQGKIKLSLAILDIVLILSFISIRIPMVNCDVYKMAKKYEEIKYELESFTSYLDNHLERGILLEFNQIGVEKIVVKDAGVYYKEDLNAERIDSLCQLAGIDKKVFKYIKKELKNIDCISVNTLFSDACEIGYKRFLFGKYSFVLLTDGVRGETMKILSNDILYIPYDDKCLFKYEGGAFDSQLGWSEGEKAEALEKFKTNLK